MFNFVIDLRYKNNKSKWGNFIRHCALSNNLFECFFSKKERFVKENKSNPTRDFIKRILSD